MPADATAKEIARESLRLKQAQELGVALGNFGAFRLPTRPSADEIRESAQRLRDPERRILDEFFWFWPEEFGKSGMDPAIAALHVGDRETAVGLWLSRELKAGPGSSASHNLAIARHLTALETETREASVQGEGPIADLDRLWSESRRRWEALVGDDALWVAMRERLRALDDPRLTIEFAERIRAALPEALARIHGELALAHHQAGRLERAAVHARWMRESGASSSDAGRVAERVMAPWTRRLREQLAAAKRAAESNPAGAASAAEDLAAAAAAAADLFHQICGAESGVRKDLFDEVASGCNHLQLAYDRVTGDEFGCLRVLKAALPLASFPSIRIQIEKNIAVLEQRLRAKQASRFGAGATWTAAPAAPAAAKADPKVDSKASGAPPVIGRPPERGGPSAEERVLSILLKYFGKRKSSAVVAELRKSLSGPESPAQRMMRATDYWAPRAAAALSELDPESDAYWELCDAMVEMLRRISKEARFGRGGLELAVKANDLAFRFAKSHALWNVLKGDRDELRRRHRRVEETGRATPWAELLSAHRFFGILTGGLVIALLWLSVWAARDQSRIRPVPAPPSEVRAAEAVPDRVTVDREAIRRARDQIDELMRQDRRLQALIDAVQPPLAYDPAVDEKHRLTTNLLRESLQNLRQWEARYRADSGGLSP